jgi:alanine racemase
VGYADGYTRLLSHKAMVIIRGQKVPVLGTVCMDQFMVDVTAVPDVKIGDEVVLIGQQGGQSITADELARLIGTINYEIVCMISDRVPRIYV